MNRKSLFKAPPSNEVMRDFFSSLYMFTYSGISIRESLDLIGSNKKQKGFDFLNSLRRLMDSGLTLGEAFENCGLGDSFVISIIQVGELGDSIPEAIYKLEEYYDNKLEVKGELYKIFAYPIILLVSIVIFVIGIIFYIVPKIINDFYPTVESVPNNLKIILNMNDLLKVYGVYIFFIFALVVVSLFTMYEYKAGRIILEKYLEEKTIFSSIMKKLFLKELSWKLFILLESSMDLYNCLSIIKDVEKNYYHKLEIQRMMDDISKGNDIEQVFENSPILDNTFKVYTTKGCGTNSLDKAFKDAYEIYNKGSKEYIKKMKVFAQPILICTLGIIVGILVIFVMSITDVSNFYGDGVSEWNYMDT